MNMPDLLNVSPMLLDRVRLLIMANLAMANRPVEFNTLLQELELTKGNLSSHIRKLEEAQLIEVHKEFVGKKPKTSYVCTPKGKNEVKQYLKIVETLLKQEI